MSGKGASPRAVPPVGAAVLDASGSISLANEAFARFAGSTVGYLLGRRFFDEFGAVEQVREAGRAFLTPGGAIEADLAVPVFGISRGDFRIRIRSLDAPAGRFALVLVEEAGGPKRRGTGPAAPVAGDLDALAAARHEINNSLMGIFGHLEILLTQPDTPDGIRRRAEILLRETEKIRDRVAELKTIRTN